MSRVLEYLFYIMLIFSCIKSYLNKVSR